jgi:hypothetical protein
MKHAKLVEEARRVYNLSYSEALKKINNSKDHPIPASNQSVPSTSGLAPHPNHRGWDKEKTYSLSKVTVSTQTSDLPADQ